MKYKLVNDGTYTAIIETAHSVEFVHCDGVRSCVYVSRRTIRIEKTATAEIYSGNGLVCIITAGDIITPATFTRTVRRIASDCINIADRMGDTETADSLAEYLIGTDPTA